MGWLLQVRGEAAVEFLGYGFRLSFGVWLLQVRGMGMSCGVGIEALLCAYCTIAPSFVQVYAWTESIN